MKNNDRGGSPQNRKPYIPQKTLAPTYTNSPAIFHERNPKYNIMRNQSLAIAAMHNSRESARPKKYAGSLPPIALHTVDSQKHLQKNLIMAIPDRGFSSSSNNSLEREQT